MYGVGASMFACLAAFAPQAADARLSEVAVAFVRAEPGRALGESELIDYCRGKIASFKIPRHVFVIDDFPWTGSGKIQKVKLREEALRRLA